MNVTRIVGLSIGLWLGCTESAPEPGRERDGDDGAEESTNHPASEGDDSPAKPGPDGGSSRGDGRSARDASAQEPDDSETANEDDEAEPEARPRPDGGDAAIQAKDAAASVGDAGGSATSDAKAPVMDPSDSGSADGEGSGPIASLLGKTMYSSKPTGAASWLVDADVGAMQKLIEADMRAAGSSKFPVFSLYRYFPNSGSNAEAHRRWVTAVAEAIGRAGGPAVVVVEPDAFALGTKERPDVDSVLDGAIAILKDKAPNAAVFLDIGHSNWIPAAMVVSRAKSYSNYASIDGWASNTSNFQPMQSELAYAKALFDGSGKPVIIDSSRNGRGTPPTTIFNPPASQWDPGPPFAFHPDDPAVLFNYYNKPSNERD